MLKPQHEEAAMQRVICLGPISEFVPSIEGATRIIERKYYNSGDAYYWRAWNHYQRKDLPTARADIERARALLHDIKVLILGGMIKFDQGHLDPAEADLTDAIKMDRENQQCIARWYYGLVSFARERWPEAADRFANAGACYQRSADQSRRELERMKKEAAIKEDTDPDGRSTAKAQWRRCVF